MLLSDLTTSNSLKSWRYPSSFQTAISQKAQLIFPNYLTSHDRRSIPQNRQLLWADCHLYNGCHGLNAQCYNSVRSSVTNRGEREMSPGTWWTHSMAANWRNTWPLCPHLLKKSSFPSFKLEWTLLERVLASLIRHSFVGPDTNCWPWQPSYYRKSRVSWHLNDQTSRINLHPWKD